MSSLLFYIGDVILMTNYWGTISIVVSCLPEMFHDTGPDPSRIASIHVDEKVTIVSVDTVTAKVCTKKRNFLV